MEFKKIYIEQIIADAINKYVESTILYEYAHPRKAFIKYTSNLLPQIITHWCLIKYSRLSNTNNDIIKHWKAELISWVDKIIKLSLKGKDDYNSRYSAIASSFDINDYDKNIRSIEATIISKFIKEGFDVENDVFEITINDCLNEHKVFINLLSQKNIVPFYEYIKSL